MINKKINISFSILVKNRFRDCGEEVFSCQISPLKIFLAVTLNNGIVKIFRLADYAHVYSLYNDEVKKEHLPAVCCDWISDSRLLVGYASGSIRVRRFVC